MNIPDFPLTPRDIDILEARVPETLREGCRECGFKHVIFDVNVTLEANGTRVYFLTVECPKCKCEYTDIMEMVAKNENIKYN
tara:strand:- start:62 stop:307 length:246 start_codon:yes stop_codon:yes gene_type:complete